MVRCVCIRRYVSLGFTDQADRNVMRAGSRAPFNQCMRNLLFSAGYSMHGAEKRLS